MLCPKAVLITGANRGIGLEFVKQFVKLSSPPKHVFATCRDPENAEELKNLAQTESFVKVLKLDTSEVQSIEAAKTEVESELEGEGLNLLINNAAIIVRTTLDHVTEENMISCFQTNTVGPLMMAKTFLPLLKTASTKCQTAEMSCSRAAIINITSLLGSIDDNRSGGYYAYRASKVALNMITKSLSVDLKSLKVLAVVLHPGWVKTDMGGQRAKTETPDSVAGMMKVMEGLEEETTGKFYNFDGKECLW